MTTADVHDLVVIGAGPAGSTVARLVAARGHDVVALEEHDEPGVPVHCTGLLGFEAFDEFDLPADIVLARAGSARFWGAAGESVRIRSERIGAAVIDRAALDRVLADRAAAAGAAIRYGARVDAIGVDAAGVSIAIRGSGHPLRARACVLACGANYRFHRPLGLGLPALFLQSAQIETPFSPAPDIEVRFGREVAPGGFAWMVPFRRGTVDYARLGLMSETRGGDRFAAFVAALAARSDIDPRTLPPARRKMLPLGPVPKTYADRVLAVGDAAGLVKPTTGGGIYYGMLSATLAAGVLADGLDRDRLDERHLQRYEARWRRRLGHEIRVGLAFRRIAARLSDESIDQLVELARVDGVVPLLQEKGLFNWHRKAAVALLTHPAFRRIALKSWTTRDAVL